MKWKYAVGTQRKEKLISKRKEKGGFDMFQMPYLNCAVNYVAWQR
jgi:hypothetical protein